MVEIQSFRSSAVFALESVDTRNSRVGDVVQNDSNVPFSLHDERQPSMPETSSFVESAYELTSTSPRTVTVPRFTKNVFSVFVPSYCICATPRTPKSKIGLFVDLDFEYTSKVYLGVVQIVSFLDIENIQFCGKEEFSGNISFRRKRMKILDIFKRLFNEAEPPRERFRRRVSDELSRTSLPGFGELSSIKDFFWSSISRAKASKGETQIPKTGLTSSYPVLCNPYSRRSVRYLRWPERIEKRSVGPEFEVLKLTTIPVVPVSTGLHDRDFRGLEIRPVVNDDERIGMFAPMMIEPIGESDESSGDGSSVEEATAGGGAKSGTTNFLW